MTESAYTNLLLKFVTSVIDICNLFDYGRQFSLLIKEDVHQGKLSFWAALLLSNHSPRNRRKREEKMSSILKKGEAMEFRTGVYTWRYESLQVFAQSQINMSKPW